ncbi:MAG: lysophospholipid acyltransferase family protein [Pseudomonadota bacterium]
MQPPIYRILNSRPFIVLLYRVIRLYCRTFRLAVENESAWMSHLKAGGTVLLCTWHQQFFSAIRYFQNYRSFRPGLMISRSRDGEIIAGVAACTGWHPVRGSSSTGGKEALNEMVTHLSERRLAGHILDGPKGPAGTVKAGVIRLAHAAGAVIVPFTVTADKCWYAASWDRFMVPKPFSRVRIRYGDMIRFPTPADHAGFESQRQALEDIMLPALVLPDNT